MLRNAEGGILERETRKSPSEKTESRRFPIQRLH